MATKKGKSQDAKLVAAKQNHESEVKYIAKTYKIPIAVVRKTMKDKAKKKGGYCRSRKVIYAALREQGYEIKTRTTK
jgi:hypothetical protein